MCVFMRNDLAFQRVRLDCGDGAAVVAEMCELYDGLDIESSVMLKAGAAERGSPAGASMGRLPRRSGGLRRRGVLDQADVRRAGGAR
jgi:hypothetical protein